MSIALFGMDTYSKEIDKGLQELKNWTRKIEFEMMENVSIYAAAISDLDRKHLEYIGKNCIVLLRIHLKPMIAYCFWVSGAILL